MATASAHFLPISGNPRASSRDNLPSLRESEEEKKILGPSILSSRTDSLRTKWVYVICLIKIQRLTLPKLVLYYNKCVGNTLNRYWRKIKCVHVTDGPLALNWIYRDILHTVHPYRQHGVGRCGFWSSPFWLGALRWVSHPLWTCLALPCEAMVTYFKWRAWWMAAAITL